MSDGNRFTELSESRLSYMFIDSFIARMPLPDGIMENRKSDMILSIAIVFECKNTYKKAYYPVLISRNRAFGEK